MSQENNTTVKAEVSANKETTVKTVTMEQAVKKAINDGKTFKLIRKVHTHVDKKIDRKRKYYSYSVFIILGVGKRSFWKEVSFLPNIGYVKEDDSSKRIGSNSASYKLLNWLYAVGNGLTLEAEDYEVMTRDGKPTGRTDFRFYAATTDDSGIKITSEIVPANLGDKQFILSAFAGFGKCRDYTDEDLFSVDGLADAMKTDIDDFDDIDEDEE